MMENIEYWLGIAAGISSLVTVAWVWFRARIGKQPHTDGQVVRDVVNELARELDGNRTDAQPRVAGVVADLLSGEAAPGDPAGVDALAVKVSRHDATHFSVSLQVRSGAEVRVGTHPEPVPWHLLPTPYREVLLREGGDTATFMLLGGTP